ncbi:family 20 glycosylhydrolase [Rugamonas rubra]|uniref:beta-N-acetylhexosaminidase n=1 Tax=Rugamonas rubra TaxID=758825 RepID=A0A1I4RHK8_9BURK|nr:family 20 glycosylhydrolase [Rugamonas rubra]SFM51731.1 hexosaminidase [Rugamonas rubra]
MPHTTGASLGITWECVANRADDTLLAELGITNHGATALPASGWALYFNTCRMIDGAGVSGGAVVEHVNGDLFRLRPGPDWGALAPGARRVLRYTAAQWCISATDAPLGFYLVRGDGTAAARAEPIGDPAIVPFSRAEQTRRGGADLLASSTPASRFEENRGLTLLAEAEHGRITPTPLHSEFQAGAGWPIGADTHIVHPPELEREALLLQAALRDVAGVSLARAAAGGGIRLRLGPVALADGAAPAEAYLLEIGPAGVDITGASAHGVANGIATLRQLLPPEARAGAPLPLTLPHCRVADAPRFAYRGMMFDVARHFASKETLLRLLDCMAMYKLNRCHLHLSDDEGWRLAIAALPELTEHGARRGFSVGQRDSLYPSFGSGAAGASAGSGHYSRADFVEILRFAAQRHITVVAEINLPGHARAAIESMKRRQRRLLAEGRPELADEYLLHDPDDSSQYTSVQLWRDNVVCIGRESAYRFLATVLAELRAMYAEAGLALTLVHGGGDEVPHGAWAGSPLCQDFLRRHGLASLAELREHFLARYRAMLAGHGAALAVWEEAALLRQPPGARPPQAPNPRFADGGVQAHIWHSAWGSGREDYAYRLANAGYPVVLGNGNALYFDLAHAKDAAEPGYYWGGFIETRTVFEFCPLDIFRDARRDVFGQPLDQQRLAAMTRLDAAGRARVLGLQGQLFGENARNRERLEYLLLPRMLALAERAWAADPGWSDIADDARRAARMAADWNVFANRLGQRELPRLDGWLGGFGYRLPPPGLALEDGLLHANIAAPGLALRYTLDGSAPSAASALYRAPLAWQGGVLTMAAFGRDGRRGASAQYRDDGGMPGKAAS